MATTTSTHNLKVKATDQTAGAFKSVGARAKATAASIRSVMGGAIAAAGAYLSVRAISQTTQELGKMSDLAMKTGASVEFLTSASTAFQVAGLDVSMESLAKSFQYMEKATGKTGEGAFWETVQSIAAIEDPLKRGTELTRIFGRSGLELQPLINGGEEAVQKFRDLQSLMPHVTSAAANAGDEVADAQTILGKGVTVLWQKVVGKLCQLFGEDFPGGVRAGALNAINWIEYAIKKAWNSFDYYRRRISDSIVFAWETLTGGNADGSASRDFERRAEIDAEIYRNAAEAADKAREEYKAKLATMSVDDLANAFGKRGGTSLPEAIGEEVGAAAAKSARRISNSLVMGGSNEARKLALLGPDYQNEAKKQTQTLRSIEGILKDIREMDTDVQLATTDLGV